MIEPDLERHWHHVDPILWDGDGSALWAMEFRRLNLPEGSSETFSEYWARVDSVTRYRQAVATWREDATGQLVPCWNAARDFRHRFPGCSFAEVMAYVEQRNERDGMP